MTASSVVEALGGHADAARDLVVEVVRARHDRSVEAHEASGSRHLLGFGSQWRDLYDETNDAFTDRGYRSYRLAPAGWRLPIVNGCLLVVWRVPSRANAIDGFASSKTWRNGFFAQAPLEIFGDSFLNGGENARDDAEEAAFENLVEAAGAVMPVVLVMMHSTPRQLSSIEWALAEYESATGLVRLQSEEVLWRPELVDAGAATDVESFDSGSPVAPSIALQSEDQLR
ncbi:hypothetical protein [Plantibacter sp. MMLR14_011]|uniref:hypothetical protein n=1 Tax=Plantibacter sp. MMLR14_011 TaxID=1898746 RepID=UPI0008DE3B4E|nr:hypothetical protein [Plantibacter sp. MMLR14_011]OII39949.1 hypothetical protein BIU99_05830 [Plantibacter sp. MMLR14_011]